MKKPNKKSGKAAKTTKAKLAHSQKNTGSSTLNNEGINRDELDSILFLIDHRNAQKAAESKTPKQKAK
jgi:hypothetical protein